MTDYDDESSVPHELHSPIMAIWHRHYKTLLQRQADKLYDADPDCEHDIVDGDNYSGIKCSKCPGWYCA